MDLDFDGGQAAVQDLADHAARFDEKIVAGELLGQLLADLFDVHARRRRPPIETAPELDAQERRVRSVVGGVDG